ncbi:hypothetical protein GHT06_019784 [Daphnia sinensis]|uniref:Uncharacterized protein n=1 Tax=Daphnia sinensis TaxID=1820382 RepID=A0AAD5KKK1_9CRUS|nr:hypothetical protein GHT06_019784 [Daphnia sinensis]
MMMMKDRVTKNQIDFSRWTTSSFLHWTRHYAVHTPLVISDWSLYQRKILNKFRG